MKLEDNDNKIKNVPALVINDNVVREGKILTVREIIKHMSCLTDY